MTVRSQALSGELPLPIGGEEDGDYAEEEV
jgi:hypothetical protein